MPEWSTACPDWAERIRSGRSIIPPPIFPKQAERALEIFRSLKIADAPGSPTFGACCAPWVFDLVASIFGAEDPDSGRRLITEWFLLIAKKNSKSTVAAGVMMTALVLNWRASAEFAILAPTIEVAGNSFAPSRDMCSERHDEDMSALMQVQTHIKTITNRQSQATLKVVAADSETVGGKKSVGTAVDELWLFGKQANAENMLREATGGLASRPEGFTLYLTTQSDDPPAGIFSQKLQYARGVRDGRIVDPQFVPVIYEFPPDMVEDKTCRDPKHFWMVNPNMNYSVDQLYLEREMRKAEEAGEESIRGFLAKHLNVEIGLALRSDRWAGADFWQQAAEIVSLEQLIARCEVAVVGIDGGGLDDLLGLAVVGRERGTQRWLGWFHAWAHRIALDRRKDISPRLLDFQADGDLTIVEVPGEDVVGVADIVCRIRDAGLLPVEKAVGVDQAGIGDIVDELSMPERGIAAAQIIGISQGWRLNGAIKSAERKLAGRELIVATSRLMPWCVGNARTEPKGNAITITKQASGSAKIDPLMALFDAVALMGLNPRPSAPLLTFF
jgi:phage terminase large subunit-like protein